MGLFRALAFRPFALLWSGQAVSRLGDSFYDVALAWWVLDETGSATATGLVLVCATVPELVFLLIGGVAVDRFSRLHLMLGSDVLRGVIVTIVALLAWRDALALWHVLVLSALFGAVQAFFYPAATAVLPDLVPAEALPSANSLRALGVQSAAIAGPALAGVVIALGGAPLAFALDAVTFVISAVCVAAVARLPALQRRVAATIGVVADLRRLGFATVTGSPWLWITIGIAAVSNITLAGPIYAALPLLVREELDAGVRTFALLESLAAAGAVVAAVILGRRTRLRRRGVLTYGAWLFAAIAAIAMGLPISVAGVAVAFFVYGAAETMLGLVWANTLQEETLVPRDRLGRVSSIDALGSASLLPVGFALAGIAADRIGPAPVFVIGGAISALIIGAGLLHPAVRHLD